MIRRGLSRRVGRNLVLLGMVTTAGLLLGLGHDLLRFGQIQIGALHGALIAGMAFAVDVWATARLRRLDLFKMTAIVVVLQTLAVLAALTLGQVLFRPHELPPSAWLPFMAGYWAEGYVWRDLLVVFPAMLVVLSFVELGRLQGFGMVSSFLLGRYHHPQREFHLFLFLDLVGSTPLAERLGDEPFHRFIWEFFDDLAEPILESGAEIHRYLGDEVVATWRLDHCRHADWAGCLAAVDAQLARRADWYRRRFGEVPAWRAGLHAGSVLLGEVGRDRREIIFLGDTINTAARIAALCKDRGRRVLISAEALEAAPPPPGLALEALGEVALKGRARPVALFAPSEPGPLNPD